MGKDGHSGGSGRRARGLSRLEFLRLVGAGAGVAVVPASLAACGGGGQGGGSGEVEWSSWNPSDDEAKQLIEMFNKSNSNVEVSYKAQEYNEYIQSLKLNMASGRGADVIGLQAGAMLLEYDEFIADLTPYAKKAFGDDWESRFYDVGIEQLQSDGKTSALPAFNSAAGYVWYNKTIFDRYDLQPPETFDEWVQVSRQLEAKGVTPFIQGAKDAWVNYDMYIALAHGIAPGKIYEAEVGEVPWTDPDLVEAMALWGELFENGIMQEGALGITQYPDAHDTWTKGEAAMILFGMWNNDHMLRANMKEFQSSLGFKEEWEFLPFLFPSVNGGGQEARLFGGPDVALALNGDSDVSDAAWKFIDFLVSEEAQKYFAGTLRTPAVKGVPFDSSGLLYPETQKPVLEQELEDFENSIGKREFLYPDLKTALADALQMVASGESSPKQAMQDVERASQQIER